MIIEDVTLIHKKLPLEVEQINISVGCFQNVMKVAIYKCTMIYRVCGNTRYSDCANIILLLLILVCLDTPFWENGHGHNCASYESQWCENGGARAGQEWTLGAKYHYPENNCCACGKKGKREYS